MDRCSTDLVCTIFTFGAGERFGEIRGGFLGNELMVICHVVDLQIGGLCKNSDLDMKSLLGYKSLTDLDYRGGMLRRTVNI